MAPKNNLLEGLKKNYPKELETYRTTKTGLKIFLRPVKITDEPLLKDFFSSLSNESIYKRFISARRDMPHERLQEFVITDYQKAMVILATISDKGNEKILAVGQYELNEKGSTADVALVVRDDYQDMGIGHQVLAYLTYLATRQGLLGFTAEVLVDNEEMLKLFEDLGFDINKTSVEGVYEMRLMFK